MPQPTARGSRPTARRVRFATTATVYGEDSALASAPVRGGPRLTVRSRRPGPSSSSSSKSAPSTSNATRSSSRLAASRPQTPSVDSPTLSTSSRPFRSVSFARAAARAPSPPPAPAPAPAPAPVRSSARLASRSSARVPASAPAPAPAPAPVSRLSSRFFGGSSVRVPVSRSAPVSSAPVSRLVHRSSRSGARVPVSSAPVSSTHVSRVVSPVSAPSPSPSPSPVESAAGAAADACVASTSVSSVVSRSASPPAASVRFESATSCRSSRLRPRSPLPDSRPLLTDSDTRRLDDVENGIRQLREAIRNAADDHHRMVRPRPAAAPRPRRTPTSIDALAAPRPRNPTPATAQAMTRTRAPIKAPAAPSAPLRVPRTRPHAPATAQAEPRSRTTTQSSRPPTRSREATCSSSESGTVQTNQSRTSTPTAPAAPSTKPTRVATPPQPAVVENPGLARFRRAGRLADVALARLQSTRDKIALLHSGGSGRRPPRSVAFNDDVDTTIVDRWITREDVYPEPPKIAGSLQGWKTDRLPRPTDDGEELHYTTYWCSVQCSQLTHSHYDPCARGCAWNRLAQIQRWRRQQRGAALDDLAYLSTAAVFEAFNIEREALRKKGLDLP